MNDPQLDRLLTQAHALIGNGAFDQARPILLDATRRFPQSAEAWKALGIAENKLGNQDLAEEHLARSVQLDDGDLDAWSSLGGVYVALGRYDDALRAFERGLSDHRPHTYALLNYLTMAALVGDYEAAVREQAAMLEEGRRACEAQIARGENEPWSYYDLAQILFFEKQGATGAAITPDADFRAPLREGIRRSSAWQATSARRTYELLARNPRFAAAAREVHEEFDRSFA
jgi:tetratricopeptide (TPR) repeat protein